MLKFFSSSLVAVFAFSSFNLYSQDNNVVLQYDQLNIGYSYADGDLYSHGPLLEWSERYENNLLLGLNLGYTFFEDIDLKILQPGIKLGYVHEFSDSLHLVPSLGLNFAKTRDWQDDGQSWFLLPSLSLNYAAEDSLELSVGVSYAKPFESELNGVDVTDYFESTITGSLGSEYALSNNIGLITRFLFTDANYGLSVGISINN
tara:strand:+ start:125 stop:733 length:609 start_codon:yes stop_codon:yes gene_type:complete